MADADHFISDTGRRTSARQDEVINRLVLCTVVAAIEGAVALVLVLCVAVTYHLVFLQQSLTTFSTLFYLAYGILIAGLHATFAALSCARFLEQNVTTQAGISRPSMAGRRLSQ